MHILALVPAHNEADQIAATLTSLLGQTQHIDRVVVIANNCTDDTADIARTFPVEVFEVPDCPGRKAEAMNHGWLRQGLAADLLLTMDADTTLMPDTVEQMVLALEDEKLGAVCARYWSKAGSGLAWQLQRLEYARYDDNRNLRNWKVQVSSGAASLYRVAALRDVCDAFERATPWDEGSLIEDYALTLDLKTVGYQVKAAPGARVLTDTPATFRALWQQRLRWGRGGMDECRKRGWTPATRRDICTYGLFTLSMGLRLAFVIYVALLFQLGSTLTFSLAGFLPLALFWLDRVASMWRLPGRTWRDVALAATLVIEDAYGLLMEACTLASAHKSFRATRQAW